MKPCCEDLENRFTPARENAGRKDLTITMCSVCGCKHYELEVDAGVYNLKMA
jgi:hypothetical protein